MTSGRKENPVPITGFVLAVLQIISTLPKSWFAELEGEKTLPQLENLCRYLTKAAELVHRTTATQSHLERHEGRWAPTSSFGDLNSHSLSFIHDPDLSVWIFMRVASYNPAIKAANLASSVYQLLI